MPFFKSALCLLGLYLVVIPHFLIHGQTQPRPENSTEKAAFDTIFRSATNSPGYLVVKKSDWDELKRIWTDSLSSQQLALKSELNSMQIKLDSLIKEGAKSPELEPQEKPKTESSGDTNLLIFWIALGVFACYGLGTTFYLISQKNAGRTQHDRLALLENDLMQYKKVSIERERKLMRELIDTRNELQEKVEKEKPNPESDSN